MSATPAGCEPSARPRRGPPRSGALLLALAVAAGLAARPSGARGPSVTLLVHGWDADGSAYLWTAAWQGAVAPAGLHGTITVTAGAGGLRAVADPWAVDLAAGAGHAAAVRVDWSAVANHLLWRVAAQEVAAAVAPLLYRSQNGAPPLCELPLHLIGHSRGAGLACQLARLLGEQGIEVDHLTLLDPHPLTRVDPQVPLLAPILDAPVAVYENVLFADSYWQDLSYPAGERVAGAYNRHWAGLPGGYHYSANPLYRAAADHLNVHLAYLATVDLAPSVTDGLAAAGPAERAGWFGEGETRYGVPGGSAGHACSRGRDPGLRRSDSAPDSGGDPLRAGLRADPGSGGAGARQPLDWSAATWPNLLALEVSRGGQLLGPGPAALAAGDTVTVRYARRDPDSGCRVTLFLDRDWNPRNGNALAALGSQAHQDPTGAAVEESALSVAVPARPAGAPAYLGAAIDDGVRTRYLYARTWFVTGETGASDFDGSGAVDLDDFYLFADAFGQDWAHPGYEPAFDLDGSGAIDLDDFFHFADAFGSG